VQLLKIDLRSFLELLLVILKLGEGSFGMQGCATTKVWFFATF